jgi:hypothetical protein
MSAALVDFLLERIHWDEVAALDDFTDGPEGGYCRGDSLGETVLLADPERVLVECQAKRLIIEQYRIKSHNGRWAPDLEMVLLYLALSYADHRDYREEWRV